MNTLTQVQELVEQLFGEVFEIEDVFGHTHELSIVNMGYTFKFDNAKSRFGCCMYRKKQITLSKHLCNENPHQIYGKIKDTILHEMAHAFCVHIYGSKDGRGHDYKWRSISKQIGCDGKRCYSSDDFGGVNMPESKYTLTCPSCGKQTPMHRKLKRSYSCSDCSGGRYNPEFKLQVTQNY